MSRYVALRQFHRDADAVAGGAPDPLDRFWYGLTFAHAVRGLSDDGIDGPDIPHRDDPERTSNGTWAAWLCDVDDDVFHHVISAVLNEAVHEALEWLRLDGEVLVDPHGQDEGRVFAAVAALVDDLLPVAQDAFARRSEVPA